MDPDSQDRAYLDAVVDGVLLVAEGEEAVPALEIKLPAQLKIKANNALKKLTIMYKPKLNRKFNHF